MSRHHRYRRFVALAACVGSTAAVAALGSAAPALATVTCAEPGFASGSSLQSTAQTSVWLGETGWPAHSSCSVKPTKTTITYTKSSSGEGLNEFGNNSGVLTPKEDPTAFGSGSPYKDIEGEVLDNYVGTDDAPTTEQLGEAWTAAGAKALAEITLPVAQAPVAVLWSLPAGCKVEEGSQVDINNATLGQPWEGTNPKNGTDPGGIEEHESTLGVKYPANTWGAYLLQLGYVEVAVGPPAAGQFVSEGGACNTAIKAQVRSTESGTSFAFKNYLKQINHNPWQTYANDFVAWPSPLVVQEDGGVKNKSGGNLASNTAGTPGSVGYANTADAAGNGAFSSKVTETKFGGSAEHQIVWAQIQNNGTSTSGATYENPLVGVSNVANCETSKLIPTDQAFPYSYTDSWFGVVATDPNIANDAGPADYPICALTFDLVWHHYSNTKLYGKTVEAEEMANTTHDYFEYLTTQGQVEIQSNDYTRFPTPMAAHVAVAVAAIKK
jgi:ABC-type phosphate transport system substrate-binding protein